MPAQTWLNACLPQLVSPLACLCVGVATCLPLCHADQWLRLTICLPLQMQPVLIVGGLHAYKG